LCFSLYFWIKLLAGTAEWFELILFTLGIICIGIEFFVIPGFGIFGIGGFLLTGLAIVLMSQTFVIPRNTYQLNAFSHGVWVMLGGFAGLLTGLILMRTLLSRIPGFRGLVMDSPDLVALNDAERIENYDHLLGADGVATTPLHPSGKAKFGEETVQVVSEGIAIESGTRLKVIQVFANRVIVEQTLE
ncbi:nodulation protein NfeD, partial [Rubripirellula sp.]